MLELNSIFRRKNSLGRGFLGWVKFQKSPILELSSGCLGKYLTRSSVTALMVSQIFLCLLKSVRWHDLEQYLKKRRNLTKLKFEIMTWQVPDNSTSCTFGQPSFFSFFFNQSLFRLSASSTKNSKLKTHDFFVNFGRTCDFCLLFSNRKTWRHHATSLSYLCNTNDNNPDYDPKLEECVRKTFVLQKSMSCQ